MAVYGGTTPSSRHLLPAFSASYFPPFPKMSRQIFVDVVIIDRPTTNDHGDERQAVCIDRETPTIVQNLIHQSTMNPKLTPTALALALSATTYVESISISTAGEVKSSDRQNDGIKKSYDRRRAEQQIISNTLHGISIHGSTIEVVDVGILAVEEDGHRHHDTMPLFRQRGVKVKVAASVSVSTVPRFLQEGEPTCAYPDTCEPNLCACTAKGGYVYDCAAELNAVCNKVYDDNGKVWTLEGCTGDVAYYANTYCPFAKCIVEGGAYGECSCQFYQNVCDLYGDRQKYAVRSGCCGIFSNTIILLSVSTLNNRLSLCFLRMNRM